MAKALGDQCQAEFLYDELIQTKDKSIESLNKYCYLNCGSLLGKSCLSAILIADHDIDGNELNTNAFLIGKHIGIALQV